jgi:hypothetical protein
MQNTFDISGDKFHACNISFTYIFAYYQSFASKTITEKPFLVTSERYIIKYLLY